MLDNSSILRLVRLVENQAERDSSPSAPRKAARAPLPKEISTPVIQYLLEPYENGYWQMRANWDVNSDFAKFILEELGTLSDIEPGVENNESPGQIMGIARKMSDEKRNELLHAANRLSSAMAVFRLATKTISGEPIRRQTENYSWAERLNLASIPEKFPEAWSIFTDRIYFDGIINGPSIWKPYRIKNGLATLVKSPNSTNSFEIAAMNREELLALKDFYTALGAISNVEIRRVFSPDDELFSPYFPLVSRVLPDVVRDGQISRVFEQALAYYEDEDFQHCISSLGLIAEDYLQRIYTTMIREAPPTGATLGQTIERLQKRVDEILIQPKPALKSVDHLYDQIKALEQSTKMEDLKPLLRDFVAMIAEDRQYYTKRIDDATKPIARKSIFPLQVSDRINELLKWRNAASHNSRIPLGVHEADRTLYCLIGVITWWQDRLASLDWSLDRVRLIETLLVEAKVR